MTNPAPHPCAVPYLELLPEALFDLVRGLGQLAQLPHAALDLCSVDAGRVERLGSTATSSVHHNAAGF